MIRMVSSFVLVSVAVLCGSVATIAQEEPAAKWDQERVAGYAQELADACSELNVALSAVPLTDPSGQRAFHQARDDVRMMDHSAKGLASALAAGEGRDEVLPRFKRIESLRRNAEENGRKALIPDPVFQKITPVGTAVIKLAPYFR